MQDVPRIAVRACLPPHSSAHKAEGPIQRLPAKRFTCYLHDCACAVLFPIHAETVPPLKPLMFIWEVRR